eukprot:2500685-Prymnesium_polylepis.1
MIWGRSARLRARVACAVGLMLDGFGGLVPRSPSPVQTECLVAYHARSMPHPRRVIPIVEMSPTILYEGTCVISSALRRGADQPGTDLSFCGKTAQIPTKSVGAAAVGRAVRPDRAS